MLEKAETEEKNPNTLMESCTSAIQRICELYVSIFTYTPEFLMSLDSDQLPRPNLQNVGGGKAHVRVKAGEVTCREHLL